MFELQLPKETCEELHSRAKDFGFKSAEDFVCYVLRELLEAIKNKDFCGRGKEISELEEKELRAKLRNLGYM